MDQNQYTYSSVNTDQNNIIDNRLNDQIYQSHPIPPCMRTSPIYQCPYVKMNGYRAPNLWSFGPFSIEYSIRPDDIGLVFKYNQKVVNDGMLTLSNPDFNFKLDLFSAAKINLAVEADFKKKRLTIFGLICIAGICNSFTNTIVATW